METPNQTPQTLQEAITYFSDPDRCFEYAVKLRWPDGKITCPRCGSTEHSFISTRRLGGVRMQTPIHHESPDHL